jgi:hypothetical protein
MVKASVRRDVNVGSFRGVVKVYDNGRFMYSAMLPIHRLNKADAMLDAQAAATEAMEVGYVNI